MPKIRQFENTIFPDPGPLGVAGRRQDVTAGEIGNTISGIGRSLSGAVDTVEKHVGQQETSKLTAEFATVEAQLTEQLDQARAKADPNNPTFAQDFLEKTATPAIDKLGDGLITEQGQAAYAREAARLKANFTIKAHADQANLAGEAAVANLDIYKNAKSNTLRIDPTGFDDAIAGVHDQVQDMVLNHHLPQSEAIKLEQNIKAEFAKSAFYGLADKNPAEALKQLDAGKYANYVDGVTAKGLERYAIDSQKSQVEAEKQAREQKRQAIQDKSEETKNGYIKELAPDANGKINVPPDFDRRVFMDDNLTPEAKENLRGLGRAMIAEDRQEKELTQGPMYARGMEDIQSGQMTDAKLIQMMKDGLSVDNYNRLYAKLHTRVPVDAAVTRMETQTLAEAKSHIYGANGSIFGSQAPTPDQTRRLTMFQGWMYQTLEAGQRAGKDPISMLTPGSPDYILGNFKDMPGKMNPWASWTQPGGGIQGNPLAPVQNFLRTPPAAIPDAAKKEQLRKMLFGGQ